MAFRAGPGIWWFIALSGVGIGCFSVVDNFYFRSSGYSVAMVGVLVAVFNTSVAVAEIPSALLFDRRSHRLAIQLGNAVRTAGLVLFFLALGPGGDIGAEVLAGIGAAAMSGTSNAYVLNRISASDPDAKRRALARIALLGSATTLIGGALGIALFVLWPRLIWLGGAIFMAAAGLVFHVVREPGGGVMSRSVETMKGYVRGLGALAANPRAWLSIFAEAALIAPFVLWQLRLGASSIGALFLGFAVMKAAGVIGGRMMAGRRVPTRILPVLVIANVLAIVVFAVSDGLVAVAVAFGVHVMLHIAISIYCSAAFQEVVPDHRRAGAGSMVSLLSSFVAAGAAVLVGVLADEYSALIAVLPSIALYALVAIVGVGVRGRRTAAAIRQNDGVHDDSLD